MCIRDSGRPPERHRDRPVGRLGVRAGPRRLGGDFGRRLPGRALSHPLAARAAPRSGAGIAMLARCVVASLASALAGCGLSERLTSEPLPAPIVAPAQISASGLRAYLDTMDG